MVIYIYIWLREWLGKEEFRFKLSELRQEVKKSKRKSDDERDRRDSSGQSMRHRMTVWGSSWMFQDVLECSRMFGEVLGICIHWSHVRPFFQFYCSVVFCIMSNTIVILQRFNYFGFFLYKFNYSNFSSFCKESSCLVFCTELITLVFCIESITVISCTKLITPVFCTQSITVICCTESSSSVFC